MVGAVMALTVVAAYDISEDDRRAKIAALLQCWGTRLQYSVYVCTLEEAELAPLVDRVTGMMDLKKDSFVVFRQCATCWDKMTVVGQSSPRAEPLYWAVL